MAKPKAKKPKKPRAPKPKAAKPEDPVFVALRAILLPYAKSFHVSKYRDSYSLDDYSVRGWSIDFAGVVAKRTAVSFYLGAARYRPAVFAGASKALLAHRMKGGFFNFKTIEKPLFAELRRLVARAYDTWDPVAIAK